jgi:hypothetical protein
VYNVAGGILRAIIYIHYGASTYIASHVFHENVAKIEDTAKIPEWITV